MSQAPSESKNTAFDGRIQLNGDAAPELEVIVQLDERYIVLDHSSGELGRWDRNAVQVAPIGRGWFTLDVEDEQVTFLPRRPGHFAAATVDLVPVETTKRWWQRSEEKKPKEDEAPALSRKEQKRLRREEAGRAARSEPTIDAAPPAVEEAAPAFKPDPVPDRPAPSPIEPPSVPVDTSPPQAPEMPTPSAAPEPPAEPPSPWDDLPTPKIPGGKPKRLRSKSETPRRSAPPKGPKPAREKAPKPPKPARAKQPRGKAVELAGVSQTAEAADQKRKSALSRAFAGFWHGLKGMALRVSDELRQTGIVPFDRLPAAPARARRNENHEHVFEEHRLPGGLTRNVCHECGLVSIGGSSEDD